MSFYKEQLLSGYAKLSNPLTRYFGCLFTPIVLDELIFHECKFADQDGWFFYSVEKLEENCLIGDKRRKNCFKKLIDSGILVIERRGLPCRNWYKINGEIIDKIINSVQPEREVSSPPTEKVSSPPTGHSAVLYNEDKTLVSKKMPNINTIDNCSLNDQIYKKDYSKIKRFLRGYLISFNSSQIAKILYEFGSFDNFKNWFDENLDDEKLGNLKKVEVIRIMASRILKQIRE